MRPGKAPILAMAAALLAGTALMVPARAADEGPTFEQVLAAPDDIDLNLAYAKAQANQGHLLPAAAALERILMMRPNAHAVRLLYAVVLYRLDDLQEARAQLAMVDASQLTSLQQAELRKYKRLVANGSSNASFSGELAAGIDYNSDAIGEMFTLLDNPPYGTPSGEGTGMVFSGKVAGTLKLQDDLSLYADVGGYSRNRIEGFNNEMQYIQAELGVTRTLLKSSWQAGAVFNHYLLLRDPYLTEYGGRAEYISHPNTSLSWSLSGLAVRQDYKEPFVDYLSSVSAISGTHDGWRYNVSGSVSYKLDGASTITGTLGYEIKTASYEPFAYRAPFMEASYHALLGSGVYFDVSGDLRLMEYRKADAFFFFPPLKRRDTDGYIRAALGAPLSAFTEAGATGDVLEDIDIEGAVSYRSRSSRAPMADLNDTGAELRLVWHFGDNR